MRAGRSVPEDWGEEVSELRRAIQAGAIGLRRVDEVPPSHLWLVAAAVPLVFCAARLNNDLWYDEVYTLLHFAARPWWEIVTDYSAPNNHILYTLILHAVAAVSDQEFVLRLPGMVFAGGALWCAFWAGWRWAGVQAAVYATLWLGLTQMFLIHAMELRGYGLSLWLTGVLGVFALDSRLRDPRKIWLYQAAIVLGCGALIYTIPTNLLVVLSLAAYVLTKEVRGGLRGVLSGQSLWWVVGVCLGCALYLPVAGQLRQVAAARAGWDLAANLALVWQFHRAALRDFVPAVVFAGVTVGAFAVAERFGVVRPTVGQDRHGEGASGSRGLEGLRWFLFGLFGPFVLAALFGIRPFVRNFVPGLFFLSVGCGVLFAKAIDRFSGFLGLFRQQTNVGTTRRQSVRRLSGRRMQQRGKSSTDGNPGDVSAWGRLAAGAILLLAVALPQLFTYPQRLADARRAGRIQDGYFNFYAARFSPKKTVGTLADHLSAFGGGRNYQVVFPSIEFYPLAYYMSQAGIALRGGAPGAREELIYVIVPEHESPWPVLEGHGLDPRKISLFEFWADCGYYTIFWGLRVVDEAPAADASGGLDR